MANVVMDPGLEENTGHTFTGPGARYTAEANTGSASAFLLSTFSSGLGIDIHSHWEPTVRPLTVGNTYTVKVARKLLIGGGNLELYIDTGDGSLAQFAVLGSSAVESGWGQWEPGSFVATGTSGRVQLRSEDFTSDNSVQWLVDDLRVEGDAVAVWLAERAVAEATALLKANLATELTAIDSDRSDSLVMTSVADADYHRYERPVVAGPRAQIDIWEGDIDFEGGDLGPGHPYVDAAEARATWEIPIFIRVTFFNEGGEDGDTMVDRRRRYEAGVFNVFNKNVSGSGTYPEVRAAVITGVVDRQPEIGEGAAIAKWHTTLSGIITGEEDQ
jgi:hypothetical protein